MGIMGNRITLGGGGSNKGGSLNIFSGTTEPAEKNGIWIKSSQTITSVVQDNDVWTPNAFYNTGVALSTNFFVNQPNNNRVFYYNGYIYKFQNNTNGTGLFKAPIDTAVFTKVGSVSSADIPLYGVAQDPANPRYLYGLIGNTSTTNQGTIKKYDLENGTVTTIVAGKSYAQWAAACGSAVVYNGYFYGFYNATGQSANKPSGIFKHNLSDTVTLQITTVRDTTSFEYPRMERIGSNLYIIHLSGGVLKAEKVDLNTGASSAMTLTGDTTINVTNLNHMIYATDGSNKIYMMFPYSSDTYDKKIRVLNVETGVVSSYSMTDGIGAKGGYSSMLYHNGNIYLYSLCTTSSTDYGIYHFKLTGKSYATGTVVISRTGNNGGTYETELVSPKDRPTGTYNLFKTGYNMVHQSVGGQLVATHPVYNGNGTSWVQIR